MENCRHEDLERALPHPVPGCGTPIWKCTDCGKVFEITEVTASVSKSRSAGTVADASPNFGVSIAPGYGFQKPILVEGAKDAIAAIAQDGMKADPGNAGKLQIIAGEFHPAAAHAWTPDCEAQGCTPAVFAKSPFRKDGWNWNPFRRRLIRTGSPLTPAEVQRGFVR